MLSPILHLYRSPFSLFPLLFSFHTWTIIFRYYVIPNPTFVQKSFFTFPPFIFIPYMDYYFQILCYPQSYICTEVLFHFSPFYFHSIHGLLFSDIMLSPILHLYRSPFSLFSLLFSFHTWTIIFRYYVIPNPTFVQKSFFTFLPFIFIPYMDYYFQILCYPQSYICTEVLFHFSPFYFHSIHGLLFSDIMLSPILHLYRSPFPLFSLLFSFHTWTIIFRYYVIPSPTFVQKSFFTFPSFIFIPYMDYNFQIFELKTVISNPTFVQKF